MKYMGKKEFVSVWQNGYATIEYWDNYGKTVVYRLVIYNRDMWLLYADCFDSESDAMSELENHFAVDEMVQS